MSKCHVRTRETTATTPIMGIYAPVNPATPGAIGSSAPAENLLDQEYVSGLFSNVKSKLPGKLTGIKGKLAAAKLKAAGGKDKVIHVKQAVGTGANRQKIEESSGKVKARIAARSLLRWARRKGIDVGQQGDEYSGEWDTHGYELMLFSERDHEDVRKRAQSLAAGAGIFFGLLPGLSDGGTLIFFSPNAGVVPSISVAEDGLGIAGIYAHTPGMVDYIQRDGEGSVAGIFQRKPDTLRRRVDTLYAKIDKLKAAMEAQGDAYEDAQDYMEETEVGSLRDRFQAIGDWGRGRGAARRKRRAGRIRDRRQRHGELPAKAKSVGAHPMAQAPRAPKARPPMARPPIPRPQANLPQPQLKLPRPERLSSFDAARLGVQSYAPRANPSPFDYDYDPYQHPGSPYGRSMEDDLLDMVYRY